MFLICLTLLSIDIRAQNELIVIDKFWEALGGKSRIDSINDYTIEINAIFPIEQKILFIHKKPNLFKMNAVFNSDSSKVLGYCFNGENFFLTKKGNIKTSNDVPYERVSFTSNLFGFPLEHDNISCSNHLTNDEGIECYQISLFSKKNDLHIDLFLDSKTFLVYKTESYVDGSINRSKKYYSNYQIINGINIPHTIKTITELAGPLRETLYLVAFVKINSLNITNTYFCK